MDIQNQQSSKQPYNLVFSCSGAADVGCISDLAARKVSKEKKASMCCIAAIAAEIPEIMETTRKAEQLVAVDGCDKGCVKLILENAGFQNVKSFHLGELGMNKGETPPSEERIQLTADRIVQTLSP